MTISIIARRSKVVLNQLCFFYGPQVGDGAQSPDFEVDTTGLSACVQTGGISDCTNCGASYTFWVKLAPGAFGSILTTNGLTPKTEGILIFILQSNTDEMCFALWRQGSSNSHASGCVSGLAAHAGTWMHIAWVWHLYPWIQMYLDGNEQYVSSLQIFYDEVHPPVAVLANSRLMFLGKPHVETLAPNYLPPDLVIDKIRMYDLPLSAADVVTDYNT